MFKVSLNSMEKAIALADNVSVLAWPLKMYILELSIAFKVALLKSISTKRGPGHLQLKIKQLVANLINVMAIMRMMIRVSFII